MEKKKILDLLLSYILQNGMNKKIQDEDLYGLLKDAGFEKNEQNIVLMRQWIQVIKKVLDNPLEIRRAKAITELINTGISKEDATNAINKMVGIVTETGNENEVDVVQGINKTIITKIPEPEITIQPKQNEKLNLPEFPKEDWICGKCGKRVKEELEECSYCEKDATIQKKNLRKIGFLVGGLIFVILIIIVVSLSIGENIQISSGDQNYNETSIYPFIVTNSSSAVQETSTLNTNQISELVKTNVVSSTKTITPKSIEIEYATPAQINEYLIINLPLPETRYIEGLDSIDIDNDDIDELAVLTNLVADQYLGIISLYKWNGTEFLMNQQFELGGGYPYGINVCDINTDSYQDILISLNGLRLLLNNKGTLLDKGIVINDSINDRFLCEDINEDGKPDIVFGGPGVNSDPIKVYNQISKQETNFPSFTFQTQLYGTIGNYSVNSFNYDNVGNEEIFGRELYEGNLYVYRNSGDFDLSTILYEYSFNHRIFGVETGDFTNDGFDDFVVAKAWGQLYLFKNLNGDGFEIKPIGISTGSFFNLISFDLNKDGKLDIIAADFDGNVLWYENIGNADFKEHALEMNLKNNYGLTIGDFDGDGVEDIAFGENPVIIIFNALLSFKEN